MESVYNHKQKQEIRDRILSLIKEEDNVILLESKECLMLKQLLSKGLKDIYIPNNEEKLPKEYSRYVYPFSLKEFTEIVDLDIASINLVCADFNKTWESQQEEIVPIFKRQLLADNSYLIITASLRQGKKNETLRDIVYSVQELCKAQGYNLTLMKDTTPSGHGMLTVFMEIDFDKVSMRCLKCKSSKIVKGGTRMTKFGNKQRWYCRDCGFHFCFDNTRKHFPIYIREFIKKSNKSSRKTARDIKDKFGMIINHSTVLRIKAE